MSQQPVEAVYRYCPRCAQENPTVGTIPFRCDACDFTNYFGPVAAVGGLITNVDNELLFVRRARDPGKGKWGLPGGFVDRNESAEVALAREVKEETSLDVLGCKLLMTHPNEYNYRGVLAPVIDLFYLCQVDANQSITLELEELDHHEWSRPQPEHLENMAFLSNRLAIECWLQLP